MELLLGSIEQGLIFGILALGVYLTFRILNFPDLTVDGSFPLGGAVAATLIVAGVSPIWATAAAFCRGVGRTRDGADEHEGWDSRPSRRYPYDDGPLLDQPSDHGYGKRFSSP